MNRAKKFFLIFGTTFALVLVHNGCILAFADPAGAAQAKAQELGWDEGDITVAGVEYSSALIGWTSSVQFRSKSEPERGEMLVTVRKPTLFHDWELSEYVQGDK